MRAEWSSTLLNCGFNIRSFLFGWQTNILNLKNWQVKNLTIIFFPDNAATSWQQTAWAIWVAHVVKTDSRYTRRLLIRMANCGTLSALCKWLRIFRWYWILVLIFGMNVSFTDAPNVSGLSKMVFFTSSKVANIVNVTFMFCSHHAVINAANSWSDVS